MRPSSAPFGPTQFERKTHLLVIAGDGWVQFEQAFVDRAEFFGIERRVVDPTRRRVVEGEVPERAEQIAVGYAGLIKLLFSKEFTVQDRQTEQLRQRLTVVERGIIAQHHPEHAQRAPKIVVVGEGVLPFDERAQAGDAVVFAVQWIGADQTALFRNEQKEQTVDQPQELTVKIGCTVRRYPCA
jgi:hypothetical protein